MKAPGAHGRESYLPISEHVLEGILHEQRNWQVLYPSPSPQCNQWGTDIYYLTCLHQAPPPPQYLCRSTTLVMFASVRALQVPSPRRPVQTLPMLQSHDACILCDVGPSGGGGRSHFASVSEPILLKRHAPHWQGTKHCPQETRRTSGDD